MRNHEPASKFFVRIENYIVRIGILCASISVVLIFHFAVDRQYMVRRIYGYYSAYLTIFVFSLFVLFAVHLRFRERIIDKFWKYIGSGIAYGFLAGVIGYFFGVVLDINNVKEQQSAFIFYLTRDPLEYILVVVSYPLIALKSWLYGGVVGLSIFSLLRLFRGCSELNS